MKDTAARSDRAKRIWAERKAREQAGEQSTVSEFPAEQSVEEEKPVEAISSDNTELFPDRKVVYSGEEYVAPDPTVLMRNGKPWIPEEHGYRARIRSAETVQALGMGPFTPVPPEAGIHFVDHPLNETSTKKDGHFGSAVYLGNSALCLCPLEESMKRRKFAKSLSDGMLQRQHNQADEEARKHDPGQVGTYRVGPRMDRGVVDSQRKIMVSVPSQIK